MLSLQITDIKRLTEMLFSGKEFDRFLLHDLDLMTNVEWSLTGKIHESFYEGDEASLPKESYISWENVRPILFPMLKGKHLPLSFHIVLLTSKKTTDLMVRQSGFDECDVSSLTLNLIFREKQLYLTSGVSYLGFTLDKTLEQFWDKTIRDFLDSHKASYIEM